LDEEDYFLAFFNIGAYQETLGMNHNLFTHPSEYTVNVTDTDFSVTNAIESKNILDILDSIGYDKEEILNKLKTDLMKSEFITEKEKSDTLAQLETFVKQNGYLRTTN
jgi:arginine decarboxylase